ncbi:alkaline phosphatase family protein [Leucobacter sp. HY1908]
MLSTATDNGGRLAAIAPMGLAALARGLGHDPAATLSAAFTRPGASDTPEVLGGSKAPDLAGLPAIRSFVLIAVDGLGHANLGARIGHAPTLARMPRKRIETVAPSTTGAALTTLVTGQLPGSHGLVGYRIRHPELGLRTTLSEWEGIASVRAWQRAQPLFHRATELGARAYAIGRPAHRVSGLTRANLTGAEYLEGQRIEDRFAQASRALRTGDPSYVYLYIDELDRAAHKFGWQSDEWVRRLEQFDAALSDFLRTLPAGVGVALTADHGIVDVAAHEQVLLDATPELLDGVAEVGGEPRMRSLYLAPDAGPEAAAAVAAKWAEHEGARAFVGTREEFIASGCFGDMAPGVSERLGDVIIAARRRVAYYLGSDDPAAREMIGQHGSFSEEERGVPLALAGEFDGSPLVSLVTRAAAAYAR